jgi:hypothetical protein
MTVAGSYIYLTFFMASASVWLRCPDCWISSSMLRTSGVSSRAAALVTVDSRRRVDVSSPLRAASLTRDKDVPAR